MTRPVVSRLFVVNFHAAFALLTDTEHADDEEHVFDDVLEKCNRAAEAWLDALASMPDGIEISRKCSVFAIVLCLLLGQISVV